MPDSIKDFFTDDVWHDRFDAHILVRGQKSARQRKVSELMLEPLEDGGAILSAEVADEERTREVEVSIWQEPAGWDYEARCSCPYAHFCEHAAAALFAASKPTHLQRLLKTGSAALSVPGGPVDLPDTPAPAREIAGLEARFHLHVSVEPATSRPVQLLLQALRSPDRERWIVARPTARYGDHELPLLRLQGQVIEVDTPDGPAVLVPDPAAERRAVELLGELGLTNLTSNPSYRFLLGIARRDRGHDIPEANAWFPEPSLSTPDVFWPWFRTDAAAKLAAHHWEVEIDDDIGHTVFAPEDKDWQADLEEIPGGWFALSVGFDLDGERLDLLPILAELLEGDTIEQLRGLPKDARHLVYLPTGGALHIPAGRLRGILRHLAAIVDPNKPVMHPLDAAVVVEDPDLPIDPSPTLAKLARKLREPASKTPADPPAGLRATLRPYQLVGYRWMRFLAEHHLHGILADDMGLGKTVQTIAHILTDKQSGRSMRKPTLVVAPTSVVPNWQAEVRKFAPSLRVLVLQGSQRHRHFAAAPHADIVLTSFALLQRDIAQLKKIDFHLIVLDEAQNIKNPSAKVTKAACELKGTHRLCLSGTPIENHLGELWSLMRFLIPGFLGTRKDFRERFQNPIEKDEDEDRRAILKDRIAPLILRRTKDEVATDLPPKTILVHPVELTTGQKDLYETVRATMDKRVRDAIAARGLNQSRIVFLEALLKLRQICCDPRLMDLRGRKAPDSAKLDYFTDLVDTLLEEGRRILVFSQFTTMLQLIEDGLARRGIRFLKLTGSSKDRGGLVEKFQSGDIPLFLISLKAGGTGLNLTAADTVIHYDPWWNPAAEAQATDRAYRIGQKNPVFVHKLICTGTVEERIQALQASKSHLASSLLAGTNKATAPDEETLRHLLAPLV